MVMMVVATMAANDSSEVLDSEDEDDGEGAWGVDSSDVDDP